MAAAFRPARSKAGGGPAGGGMWRPQPRHGGTDRRRRGGKGAASPGERVAEPRGGPAGSRRLLPEGLRAPGGVWGGF